MDDIACDTQLDLFSSQEEPPEEIQTTTTGTVPSLPSDSDSAQTLDQLLEEDYQDSQIDPDNFTHSLTQYMPLLLDSLDREDEELSQQPILDKTDLQTEVKVLNSLVLH